MKNTTNIPEIGNKLVHLIRMGRYPLLSTGSTDGDPSRHD